MDDAMTQPPIPLPEPFLEGIDYELWGQNVQVDCYTVDQMRDYAAACVQAERNDVHSCHANCQRAGCVNVRLRADRDSLADALADLVRAVEQSDATPTDRAWQAAEFARHVLGDKRA